MEEQNSPKKRTSIADRIAFWFEFHFLEYIGLYMIILALILIVLNHMGIITMSDFSSDCIPFGARSGNC